MHVCVCACACGCARLSTLSLSGEEFFTLLVSILNFYVACTDIYFFQLPGVCALNCGSKEVSHLLFIVIIIIIIRDKNGLRLIFGPADWTHGFINS